MIRGRKKGKGKIYKSLVEYNRTNGRIWKEFHRVRPTFLKALEFREVLLEFR